MFIVVIDKLGIYGAERVAISLANKVVLERPVTIVSYSDDHGDANSILDQRVIRVRLTRSRHHLLALPQIVWQLRTLCRAHPDAHVVSFMPLANSLCAMAKLFCRTTLIGTEHNIASAITGDTGMGRVWKLARRLLYRRLDCLVCVSEDVRDDAVQFYRLDRKSTTVIYNPVEIDRVSEQAKQSAADVDFWRAANANCRLILLVGALKQAKNHEFAIRVLAVLPQEYRMVFVGGGPLMQTLIEKAAELGVSDRVDLMGAKQNPYVWMAQADAMIVPSLYEGFGLVIAEAAGIGTRVVAANTLGSREIARLVGSMPVDLEVSDWRSAIIAAVSSGRAAAADVSMFDSGRRSGDYLRLAEELS